MHFFALSFIKGVYFITVFRKWEQAGESFIKIENNNCPNMEPRRTPYLIFFLVGILLLLI